MPSLCPNTIIAFSRRCALPRMMRCTLLPFANIVAPSSFYCCSPVMAPSSWPTTVIAPPLYYSTIIAPSSCYALFMLHYHHLNLLVIGNHHCAIAQHVICYIITPSLWYYHHYTLLMVHYYIIAPSRWCAAII
eukprot:TRINITY_DN13665_c1_g1_i1.p1 TRINITY_DN13665_c1_g1~~TRINITY_DN13665_c1_g1_i1.p1  ORF type:complete len:133 (-),score=25.69 TRINITY_DN13665_c1_g1_i1:380-778(-)